MVNLLHIVQGWTNDFLVKIGMKENKPTWKKRLAICRKCPGNKQGVCSSDVCITLNGNVVCGCGCLILKKVKSGSACPKNYWK